MKNGEKIKKARKAKSLQITDLARLTGITSKELERIEAYGTKQDGVLQIIADKLRIPIAKLK